MSDPEIAKYFIDATRNVLQTMAGLNPVAGKLYIRNDSASNGDISAVIGISGARQGTVAMSFDKGTAIELVRGLLGDAVENVLNDAQDAVGEVSNMISGQARAALSENGVTLHGSAPSIVLGGGQAIHQAIPIVVMPFNTANGSFTVEFCFSV